MRAGQMDRLSSNEIHVSNLIPPQKCIALEINPFKKILLHNVSPQILSQRFLFSKQLQKCGVSEMMDSKNCLNTFNTTL